MAPYANVTPVQQRDAAVLLAQALTGGLQSVTQSDTPGP